MITPIFLLLCAALLIPGVRKIVSGIIGFGILYLCLVGLPHKDADASAQPTNVSVHEIDYPISASDPNSATNEKLIESDAAKRTAETQERESIERLAAANPPPKTCHDDWKLCSDNSEMANKYVDWSAAQVACQFEANKKAKYGSPSWPWLSSFSTFLNGSDYPKHGMANLIEKDAQFQNGFGAMVHVTVSCVYNFNTKSVASVDIIEN